MSRTAPVRRYPLVMLAVATAALLMLSNSAYALPNSLVNPGSPPALDQSNAEVAASEAIPLEFYSVWTEYLAPGPGASAVGWAFTMDGGLTWIQAVNPIPAGFTDEWNPAISAHSPAVGGGYMITNTTMAGPPWGGPNGISMNVSPGGGAPFGLSVMVMANTPGINWLDYSDVAVNDFPAIPAPEFGNGHMAWVEYMDLNGGDLDLNGNAFDEAGDGYAIWYSFSRFMPGPPPMYPAFFPPAPIAGGPVSVNQMVNHRPELAIVAGAGNPVAPPGAVYIAWGEGPMVFVAAQAASGAGFGLLGGGPVPLAVAPLPPALMPGIKAATTVSIAVDNSAGVCAGSVYLVYADMTLGDADIWFTSSPTGMPGTWT